MRSRCLPALPALLVLLVASRGMGAETVDLAKLDRSIAKEPKYSTAAQEYCLLVFGPKAETRVWLVRDGDVLYLDRNGNGDLTEPDEVVRKPKEYSGFSCGDIVSRDGKTTYQGLSVNAYSDGYRLRVQVPGTGPQLVGLGAVRRPRFASRAKDAPIIHFDGPLALTQFSTKRVIPRDNGPVNSRNRSLRVMIGSSGLGEGTFAAYTCRVCDKHPEHDPMMGKFVFRAASGGPPIEFTDALEKIG
jgi:hypothetical protein